MYNYGLIGDMASAALVSTDGWKAAEVEPEAALVNHVGAETVGTVVGYSEAAEAQPSLFSWTEFLAGEHGRSRISKTILSTVHLARIHRRTRMGGVRTGEGG